MMTFTNFVLCRMEKQVSWLYALDNLEFSRSKIITNGPTISEKKSRHTSVKIYKAVGLLAS